MTGVSSLPDSARAAVRARTSRSSPPLWLLVADLGGPGEYHLGDEAMFEANLAALRAVEPAAEFVAMSADPEGTARRYGVLALSLPTFSGVLPDAAWDVDAHRRRESQWLIGAPLAAAVAQCDAVVISGGGNLCASWPDKIVERVGLIHCARDRGKPALVLGQTLGPLLDERESAFLGAALRRAQLVGLRETPSLRLAEALGVAPERCRLQLDDAFGLEPRPVAGPRAAALEGLARPWILITVDASWGSAENELALRAVAAQLRALSGMLGGSLLFVPHVGGSAVPRGRSDVAIAETLRDRYDLELTVCDLRQAAEARWLSERADLVIATRYHAVVFAMAAGVPALGIHSDAYTRVKLRGALEHAGLAGWSMPIEAAASGQLLPSALELWRNREAVGRRLRSLAERAGPYADRRWASLREYLSGDAPPAPTSGGSTVWLTAVDTHDGEATMPSTQITEAAWRDYETLGYLRLGRLLDDDALAALQRRIDEIMLGRVTYPDLQFQMDTGGAYEDLPDPVTGLIQPTLAYRKVQGLEADPLFLALLRRDLLREICARHYGTHAPVSIFRAMLMNKPAGQGTYLPWHQDAGDVWKLDRDPEVTLWVALDPATKANGCVQVVPGTHRLGLLSKNGSTISDENVARHCPESAIEYLEVGAGEGLLLHNWLLHRSDVNRTDRPRRAFTACYMDGRTLNTLTGSRFPMIFGEYEGVEDAFPFVKAIRDDNRNLRRTAEEATRYARSLEEALNAERTMGLKGRLKRMLGR